MNAEELRDLILGIMQTDNTDPNEAVAALGQALLTLLSAVCEIHQWSPEVCQTSLDFICNIQEELQKEVNEKIPPEHEFMTLGELRKKIAETPVSPKQADTNARINACNLIMETDTLGFLLMGYQKNGCVSMTSNLSDPNMRDKVLCMLKEALYGKAFKEFDVSSYNK